MELFQRSEAQEENPQTGKVVKIVRNISIVLLFMLVFGLIVWILFQLSNQQNKIHEFDVKLTEYQNISERMTNKNKEFADDIRYGYSLNFYRLTPVSKPVSKRLVLGIMGRQDETYEHVNPWQETQKSLNPWNSLNF